MRRTDKHTFFFTERDIFSNWYRVDFACWGQQFNCVEQAMMWAKAVTFGDREAAQAILDAPKPADQKRMGRNVRGYDDDVWAAKRDKVIYEALEAKFSQHPALAKALLDTKGTLLVEASPYDRLYGVGLGENDPRIDDPKQWKGANKLGNLLTQCRQRMEAALAPPVETPATSPEAPSGTLQARRFTRRR